MKDLHYKIRHSLSKGDLRDGGQQRRTIEGVKGSHGNDKDDGRFPNDKGLGVASCSVPLSLFCWSLVSFFLGPFAKSEHGETFLGCFVLVGSIQGCFSC